ncbi:exodeoxyribonuclease VII small subunit [Cellulomonas chitinilytica]|uniref:exodeoxyribonuclease VII small subunit n=1 Tax=Cellulomonas chitinilytica TaxID=398759 RepID=UPI001941DC2A|nr:exodeoxyribonuclease VII small subunit [Cellulomonas chitinilytica]
MPKTTTDPRSAPAPDDAARGDATPGGPGAAFPDVSGLTYEQARDELVAVVSRLEAGAASLEDSLALWERGEALAARCQEWLDGARERLSAVREPVRVAAQDDTQDEGEVR